MSSTPNNADNNSKSSEQTVTSSTSIGHELEKFVKHIDSLAETLPLTMIMVQAAHKVTTEKLNAFVEEHCEVSQEGADKFVQVGIDNVGQYRKLHREQERAFVARKIVSRGFLVSLVSQYDAFLGGLIKSLFLIHPETLSDSDKNLTFSQLLNFGSIDNAKEYVVEKEVETVLRKSHSEQFDWLEKKFSLELRKGLSAWPQFIELTERRNLFVHSSGVVSNQYLTVCSRHNAQLESELAVGQELQVDPEYFNAAYECVFEIGVKLAHVLWRKVQPGNRKAADENLNDLCYELLLEGKYRLACNLLDFATNLKRHASEQDRRMLVVNRSQAYKWAGNSEKAEEIITSEDWSATSDDFKLAEAVLLDRFDEADELVAKIGAHADPGKAAYKTWPLFREYRKTEGFQSIFEEVFGEPYNLVSVETPREESSAEEPDEVDHPYNDLSN